MRIFFRDVFHIFLKFSMIDEIEFLKFCQRKKSLRVIWWSFRVLKVIYRLKKAEIDADKCLTISHHRVVKVWKLKIQGSWFSDKNLLFFRGENFCHFFPSVFLVNSQADKLRVEEEAQADVKVLRRFWCGLDEKYCAGNKTGNWTLDNDDVRAFEKLLKFCGLWKDYWGQEN